ncbi:MAG: hypothetical protein RLZZ182_2140 [Pseudomonadota bacterium]
MAQPSACRPDQAAPAATQRPTVHVVTWFYERQPGLAIYVARLQALMKHADVTVVCRHARDIERLGLPLKAHVIDTPGESQFDIVRYTRQAARWLQGQGCGPVVLLTAQVALCAHWLPGREVCLYWNEMPGHIFPRPRFNPFKAISHAVLRHLVYGGALKAQVVMPISHFMQQDLLARGRSLSHTPVVPMGVFGELPQPVPVEPNPAHALHVVYAGSLTEEKGRRELLDGVIGALDRGLNVRLTLVGLSRAEQDQIRRQFAEAGHGRAVQALGLLPHAEALAHVAAADVAFAMLHPEPHFQYNPPTKVFEYLACGVPVLYNDLRTLSAYLAHGRTGYCAPLSAQGVQEALRWMCENRAELASWRAPCREAGAPYRWAEIEPMFLASVLPGSAVLLG